MSWLRLHKDEPEYLVIKEGDHPLELPQKRLERHQQEHEPDDEYIKGLRQRLKVAQKQLENMRPF